MTDTMDQVQQFMADRVEDELKRRARQPKPVGLTHCEVADCGEPIVAERTRLGARLCTECQQDEDLRISRYARGRAR